MVTLKEIAAKCGCSAATVSKALNVLPDISQKRKDEIRQVAQQMGYHFNVAAKTLKTNRSNTVGLLMFLDKGSAWVDEYYGGIAMYIQKELNKRNCDLIPIDCHQQMSMDEFISVCLYHNYDGLIIMNYGYSHEHLMKLVQSNIPIVTIDDPWEGHNGVESDNFSGIAKIVDYAYGFGHRRIAFIYGNPGLATTERITGFRTAVANLQLPVPEEYIVEAVYGDVKLCQAQVSRLMDMPEPPTCIICPDDFAMIGALNELHCRSMSAPEDLSIAGYDGIQLAYAFEPQFTTVYQDIKRIASESVRLLFNEISERKNFTPEKVVVPCRFIPGGTVGKVKL